MLSKPQLDDQAAWKQRGRAPMIAGTHIVRVNATSGLAKDIAEE